MFRVTCLGTHLDQQTLTNCTSTSLCTSRLACSLRHFKPSVPWRCGVSTVNDIGLAVFGRKELSLAELVWPFNRLNIDCPLHIANQTVVLCETLETLSATVQDCAHGFGNQRKTEPIHGRRPKGKTFTDNKVRGGGKTNLRRHLLRSNTAQGPL